MKKGSIYFNILVIVTFITLAFLLTSKVFQNDTYYTIKVGQSIINKGVDMKDHFSFINDLAYTYPHWLYDVIIYFFYSLGGYTLVYLSTICLGFGLLSLLYFLCNKLTDNKYVSYILVMVFSFCLGGFITARAQSFSYLFLTIILYSIEMLRKTNKKRYLVYLFLSSLLIANMHLAVWPFIFVLFLPFVVQDIIYLINNKFNFKLEKKFNIEIERSNLKITIIGIIVCLVTGLMTPNFLVPFTYFVNTKRGISLQNISEHQPNTINHSPEIFVLLLITVILFLSKKVKIKLRDLFLLTGLFVLAFSSIRNESLLLILSIFTYARLFSSFDFSYIEETIWCRLFITILLIIFSIIFIITFFVYSKKSYVLESDYPTNAVNYIKDNLDYKNIRIFNQYNFGSYLLLNDIPVYIDSRADLYLEEFNSECTVFKDYFKMNNDYKEMIKKYNLTHMLLQKGTSFNTIITSKEKYDVIYEDDYFKLYEIGEV